MKSNGYINEKPLRNLCEILDVSKKLSLQDMANITVENLPVDKIQSATA